MIEISQVSKDYLVNGKPYRALDHVNLAFPDTGFISILGPSGCGKSTLLNLIGGLDTITEGDIYVFHHSLRFMKDKVKNAYLNNEVGFIFQNYYLIQHLNVLDNVMLPLDVSADSKRERKKKALLALEKVGLKGLEKKKPNQLSGGQAQRVAIARALVKEPDIILADEPTGALDSKTAFEIMEILKALSKTKLVILVTHNEDLADSCSDRIIRLKDGKVMEDFEIHPASEIKKEWKENKTKGLSFFSKMKLAYKNVMAKKGKTILTAVANSFGMVGIAFFLAINNGYQKYTSSLSAASASSLPVIVSSYSQNSESEKYNDKNASVLYPEEEEIYPVVSTASETSYRYNNFSVKYFSYLDSLKEEGIVKDYFLNYGNQYGYNLATVFPKAIQGETREEYNYVDTSYNSFNYYASTNNLPYNVFHVLYGDMDQYDLLEGNLPQNKNEVLLVVNTYNGISFNVLRTLGFYSLDDVEEDVEDSSLKTKVVPISFQKVLSKTYKIFTNDEVYELQNSDSYPETDLLGNKASITTYSKREMTKEFYEKNGMELEISGIIRPKKTSPFSILSPSLCYTKELEEELTEKNKNSQVAQTIKQNLVMEKPDESVNTLTAISTLINKLQELKNFYQNSDSTVFPTNELNDLMSDYFYYYPFLPNGYKYGGFYRFLNDAKSLGANLISPDFLGKDLSDDDFLDSVINRMTEEIQNGDKAFYDDVVSLAAYINAYSSLDYVIIYPTSLEERQTLIDRLNSFNEVQENSDGHASNTEEQVTFSSLNQNYFLEDVSQMISVVSIILIAFAIIALLVSSLMTMSSVSNSVLERKQEIGLLRSLGCKRSSVAWIFEIEAIVTGIFAGAAGSLLTYIFSFPLNDLINTNYPNYHMGNIADLTFWHVAVVLALSTIMAALSALIPSLKASKKNPVDCLRSE